MIKERANYRGLLQVRLYSIQLTMNQSIPLHNEANQERGISIDELVSLWGTGLFEGIELLSAPSDVQTSYINDAKFTCSSGVDFSTYASALFQNDSRKFTKMKTARDQTQQELYYYGHMPAQRVRLVSQKLSMNHITKAQDACVGREGLCNIGDLVKLLRTGLFDEIQVQVNSENRAYILNGSQQETVTGWIRLSKYTLIAEL